MRQRPTRMPKRRNKGAVSNVANVSDMAMVIWSTGRLAPSRTSSITVRAVVSRRRARSYSARPAGVRPSGRSERSNSAVPIPASSRVIVCDTADWVMRNCAALAVMPPSSTVTTKTSSAWRSNSDGKRSIDVPSIMLP